jgi:hypothetical protein
MELFRNIRLKTGKKIFKKKMAGRKRKAAYSNIDNVKNIGLVWDASNPDEFICLSKFYQKMHERKIEVKIIGYFPGKELPDKYTAIRYLTCLRRKELSVFYHPASSESEEFIRTEFDILIDVNFEKIFPLQYITSLSNAGFKVGLFESETTDTPFDLMMELKMPVSVEDYLYQVIRYLEMINSGTAKQFDQQLVK